MDKQELARRLEYPAIWLEAGLYSDALYDLQLPTYKQEYGEELPKGGTDHFRYGAFNYLLKRGADERVLGLLLDAAIADPHKGLARSAVKDVIEHPLSTRAMLDKALAAVLSLRSYPDVPTRLERWLLEVAGTEPR